MPAANDMIAFIAVVTLIVTVPGPNVFLLLRTTSTFGRRAGFVNSFGFSAAILSHALLSLLGVGAIVATSEVAFSLLKVAGAINLIWLGSRALNAAWQGGLSERAKICASGDIHSKPRSLGARFVEGYLTSFLNPKPALFYLAAFPHFVAVGGLPVLVQGLWLSIIHVTIGMVWYGAVVLGIAAFSQWMTRPSVGRLVQAVSGIALIVLGGRLLFL